MRHDKERIGGRARRALRPRALGLALAASGLLAGGAWAQEEQPPGEEMITLRDFADAVEYRALLEFAQEELGINLFVDRNLSGSIVLNAPVSFPRKDLLKVLNAMLEQVDFTIVEGAIPNSYQVIPRDRVQVHPVGPMASTRFIQTPNLRPSALETAINQQFVEQQRPRIAYLDDVGVIVVTGSARMVSGVEELVNGVLAEMRGQSLIRIELDHIAASTALQRIVELQQSGTRVPGLPGQQPGEGGVQQPRQPGAAPSGLGNLQDRLSVSPHGNALLFRGREEEAQWVRGVVRIIDQPSELTGRRFLTGTATGRIAELAEKIGLGPVIRLETQVDPGREMLREQQRQMLGTREPTMGGARQVVDEERGWIVYYGTAQQQERFAQLVEEFKIEDEIPIVRVYKLQHASAEDMAEVIQALLQAQFPGAGPGSPLLPGQSPRQPARTPAIPGIPGGGNGAQGGEGEGEVFRGGQDVFVIADTANNQLVVRAPQNQQSEFQSLIRRLDLRRPQVFLEAQIVAVSATEDFRIRFETQLINASGTGGVIGTNFGIGLPGDDAADPVTIPGALRGGMAAVIKSQYVPFVMQALQTNADGRILATPRLLVNDNEETEIANFDTFPFLVQSQSAVGVTFQSFEEATAGTTLRVQPRISEGGYVVLGYGITLSSFTGTPPQEGAPPPKRETNITDGSVTVPSGSTIVVGGLTFENLSDTIVKVPFFGDLPLLGLLFRDTQKSNQKTTIYIFLTPRIMRDPDFVDLALLTEGPQADMGLPPGLPDIKPVLMRMREPPRRSPEPGQIRQDG